MLKLVLIVFIWVWQSLVKPNVLLIALSKLVLENVLILPVNETFAKDKLFVILVVVVPAV